MSVHSASSRSQCGSVESGATSVTIFGRGFLGFRPEARLASCEWVPEGGDAFACGPSSCRITEETLSPRDDPWPGDVLHEYAPGVGNATRCGVNGKIDSCGDDGSDPCVIPDGGFCEVDCAEGYEYEVGGAAVQRPMGLHCSTGLAWCNDFTGYCMDTTDLSAPRCPSLPEPRN